MKKKSYLVLSICLTIIFVILSFTIFFSSFGRIVESLRDFVFEIYNFIVIAFGSNKFMPDTVNYESYNLFEDFFLNKLSFKQRNILPTNFNGLKFKISLYFNRMFSKKCFIDYLIFLSDLLLNFLRIFNIAFPPLFLFFKLFVDNLLEKTNNNYNEVSKPLQLYLKFQDKVLFNVIEYIKGYVLYIKENKVFKKIWIILFLYAFNFITIIIEFVAWYLYVCQSLDYSTTFMQFRKLFFDLSLILNVVPIFVWVLLIIFLLLKWRKKIGYSWLKHFECRNKGFINERSICCMFNGTMGSKKTTIISDMALSSEEILREKAVNDMLKLEYYFPNFDFRLFEYFLCLLISNHKIYTLASARSVIKELRFYFDKNLTNKDTYLEDLKFLEEKYSYVCSNFIFNYEFEKYGMTYDNNLRHVNLWDTLFDYAQLYFVYTLKTSLILGNYSIRNDRFIIDKGNLPLFRADYFEQKPNFFDNMYSHIIDFDAFRSGKIVVENNENKDFFEFGVVNLTEIGKERLNAVEGSNIKKSDNETNQKNDMFNTTLKMIRHPATIMFFPYVKVFLDEQRSQSLGADAREICEVIYIESSDDKYITLPFSSIEMALSDKIVNSFNKFYKKIRCNRADNTLFVYLLKKIVSKIANFRDKRINTFGFVKVKLKLENGKEEYIGDRYYYLMDKKIYSDRFKTDCFAGYFEKKKNRSTKGLNDIDTYSSLDVTSEEFLKQNSYFIKSLEENSNK